jgi:benzodiazapine receptor
MAMQYELWGGKTSYRNTTSMQIGALIGWLSLTFCAAATAVFVKTGGWYADLIKPTWNPPSWVFGPVWTTLYVMMAVAAWLVWREGGWRRRRRALAMYLVQWLLNAIWTPLFFALHQPGWALAEILILLAAILTTIYMFWRVRRTAALLLIPYALWTAFAAVLNFSIWRLNA